MENPETTKKLTPEEIEQQNQNLEQQELKGNIVEKDSNVSLSEINESILKKEMGIQNTQNKINDVRDELKLPPSDEIPPSIKTEHDAVEKLNQEKSRIEREQKERLRDVLRSEILTLATELMATNEVFPFPEMNPERYEKIKTTEGPGVETGQIMPIDEVITQIKISGMKIGLDKNPNNGIVYAIPTNSAWLSSDSIMLHHLQITNITNPKLAELVEKTIAYNNIEVRPR